MASEKRSEVERKWVAKYGIPITDPEIEQIASLETYWIERPARGLGRRFVSRGFVITTHTQT